MNKTTCTRCNGKGKVNFGNVSGRVCFACKGTGTTAKSQSKKFKAFFTELQETCNVTGKTEKEATRKAVAKFNKMFKHQNVDVTVTAEEISVKEW